MGGAWLTLDAWDHYAFSGDKGFLRTRAYPLLHDASLFFLDYLVDDGQGHMVTGPSLSPENRYKLPDGTAHSLTMAPTMDIEIVRELFERTLQAGTVLNIDQEFLSKVQAAMDKLPPFKIGHRGNLQEWQLDYDDAEIGHRHISHLWALFPGTQISPEHTPELAKAAQTALEIRLKNGGGQTGWSRAWVVNYWDHLGNGEQAYDSLQVLFRQSTFPNLMDTHPPGLFQIDGNLGAANGMLEALVQSRWYPDHVEVDLLPALPSAWNDGDLAGIRLRGDAELALRWSGKRLLETTWTAGQDQLFKLRLPAGQHPQTLTSDGHAIPVPELAPGVVELQLSKGKTYKLSF
jgi:alpha-L-fucosidase 2